MDINQAKKEFDALYANVKSQEEYEQCFKKVLEFTEYLDPDGVAHIEEVSVNLFKTFSMYFGSYHKNIWDQGSQNKFMSLPLMFRSLYIYSSKIAEKVVEQKQGYVHQHSVSPYEVSLSQIAVSMLGHTNDYKVFEIDEDVAKLLELTKPITTELKFPFNNFFINVLLEPEKGIRVHGLLVILGEVTPVVVFAVDTDTGGEYNEGQFLIMHYPLKSEYKFPKDSHAAKIFSFVQNFLTFINDPEVKIIKDKWRTNDIQKKHLMLRSFSPSRRIISLTGTIKRYLKLVKHGKHFSYSHKFWVRGHWRHFQSERYVNKRGQKTWIPPHIKGAGIMLTKRYRLENKK